MFDYLIKGLYSKLLIFLLVFSNISVASNLPPYLQEYFEEVKKQDHALLIKNFYTQNNQATNLDNFDNRFIVLHFWASWCMDCSIEIAKLNLLQKEFRKKSLLVIAVSEDYKDVSEIDKYFIKNKIDYLDIYIDKKNDIYQYLMLNNLPTSYLIDFNGNMIAKSKPGKKIDWTSDDMLDYFEEKVSKLQLLPPEYKKEREKFVEPEVKAETKKKKVKKEDF